VCLEETKLQTIDHSFATFPGAYKLNRFAFKLATGTKGGILLLCNDSEIELSNICEGCFSISVQAMIRSSLTGFTITGVYGPSRRTIKIAFLSHLRSLKQDVADSWLILGDFNVIYRARDKNNKNLNFSLMRRFRRTLESCGLKELHLQNRSFTWINERRRPTLVRLDRFFCNQNWDMAFEGCTLHALSSAHSNHCPLLLTNNHDVHDLSNFRTFGPSCLASRKRWLKRGTRRLTTSSRFTG
jgi:exonuclease III